MRSFIHSWGTTSTAVVLLWVAMSGLALAQSGLDTRPSNQSCLAPERPSTQSLIDLELALPFAFPTAMVQAPGNTNRWYVVDRSGFINVYQDGQTFSLIGQFGSITDRVQRDFEGRSWGEMGLLAMAFHPNFQNNGYVYLYYTADGPSSIWPLEGRLSRFISRDGGLTFDKNSEQILVTTQRDTQWHWGGNLLFGDDGYLYLSIGDGGRHRNSQDLNNLKGSMIRIDVDSGFPYTSPPDNPFVGKAGRDEIYAYGFRNPWRWNFDAGTGQMWLGDVGLNSFEEVNLVEKGGNYGWSILEGDQCTNLVACTTSGLIDPVYAYPHDPNSAFNAIIGGYVYRGSTLNNLQGIYIFGDNFTGTVTALRFDNNGNPAPEVLIESGEFLTSFAEGPDNELYLLAQNGVYRLVNGGAAAPSNFPELLSETGCFSASDITQPAQGVIPFDVNTPLWSDGAIKTRWMALPNGTTINIDANGDFEYPIGTVLIKNFELNSKLIETRLFIRHTDGDWGGYSYEWNAAQTDATLLPGSKTVDLGGQEWFYPGRNQCMQCHTDVAGRSLGPEVAQLNKDMMYPSTGRTANQLETLEHIGLFSAPLPDAPANLPALAPVTDTSQTVAKRARSYLHANCVYCHQPGGPGQGPEDFRYWIDDSQIGAINVQPTQGNLGVADGLLIYPGDASKSIMALRLHALDTNRMPPLATSVVDVAGTSVIDQWINEMTSTITCGPPAYNPASEPAVYLWEECGTGLWQLRATAGPSFGNVTGDLTSSSALTITPFSIESHDTFDTSNPASLVFNLKMWNGSEDGFTVAYQWGAGACLNVAAGGLPVYVGPARTQVQLPFDLETKAVCGTAPPPPPPPPPPPADGTAVGRPDFNGAVDAGVFLWVEPDGEWRMRTAAGGSYANFAGNIDADSSFPQMDPFSIESHDLLDTTSDPTRVDFDLQMWNDGEDGLNFRIPSSGVTCIDLTLPSPAVDIIVGANSTPITPPFDLATLGPCDGAPPPPPPGETPTDGPPPYDWTTEQAIFVWHEGTDFWRFRGTAGGDFAQYIGRMTASQPFGFVNGVSVEAHDTFTSTPNSVDFNFRIWGVSEDGFDVSVSDSAVLCLDVSSPGAPTVYVGGNRVSTTVPIDLNTMTPCTP